MGNSEVKKNKLTQRGDDASRCTGKHQRERPPRAVSVAAYGGTSGFGVHGPSAFGNKCQPVEKRIHFPITEFGGNP